ncbi:MAG TPA: hypothetical protein VGJ77_12480 [Gaiellaceae bacterium]|jgi:hypothetical protein
MDTPSTPPPGPEDETRRAEAPASSQLGPVVSFNLPPGGARMPQFGNAEWAMWFLVEVLFAIIWAASDAVDAGGFVTATAAITFAYLISRGIAKASRVLEH